MPHEAAIQRELYQRRISELLRDGYLIRERTQPHVVMLTLRGMNVLMACADRPIQRNQLPKPKEGNDGKQS